MGNPEAMRQVIRKAVEYMEEADLDRLIRDIVSNMADFGFCPQREGLDPEWDDKKYWWSGTELPDCFRCIREWLEQC